MYILKLQYSRVSKYELGVTFSKSIPKLFIHCMYILSANYNMAHYVFRGSG